MYKHCITEESAQRQRQLEQCLLELMADTPYSSITIGQICQMGGVSRKSFYRYFDSKDDCLQALLDHVIMNGTSYYATDSGATYVDLTMCTRLFEYWKQQTPLLTALSGNNLSVLLPQRMVLCLLAEEPEYARYMGIPQSDVMEHVVYTVSGTVGMVLAWHHEQYQKTAEEMGMILYQLIKRQANEGVD